MKRHCKLNSRQPELTSLVRVSGFNKVVMLTIFDMLENIVDEIKIRDPRIFNTDETSHSPAGSWGLSHLIARKRTQCNLLCTQYVRVVSIFLHCWFIIGKKNVGQPFVWSTPRHCFPLSRQKLDGFWSVLWIEASFHLSCEIDATRNGATNFSGTQHSRPEPGCYWSSSQTCLSRCHCIPIARIECSLLMPCFSRLWAHCNEVQLLSTEHPASLLSTALPRLDASVNWFKECWIVTCRSLSLRIIIIISLLPWSPIWDNPTTDRANN
jgi:hypothetical protein